MFDSLVQFGYSHVVHLTVVYVLVALETVLSSIGSIKTN